MLASTTRTTLSRSGVSPAVRVASRRVALPRARLAQRTYATEVSAPNASSSTSHLASGLAGGLAVLLGGYTYYRVSGIHSYVQTAQQTSSYLKSARDKVSESVSATLESADSSSAKEALLYLRGVAKSYAGLIPGAGSYIDATFDELDKISAEHGEEASKIANGAYKEIQSIYGEVKSKGTIDVETAGKVADVLRRRLEELYALGKKAGGDVADKFLDSHPEIKEKVGGGYDALVKLAKEKGPEAQKQLEDIRSQIKEIFAKGASPDALLQAQQLIKSKTNELRNAIEPAAQEAWDSSVKQAQPYLDKLPEIKDLLNSNTSAFLGLGAGALGGQTKEIFEKLKGAAEAKGDEQKKKVGELKELVLSKAKEAQDKAGSKLGVSFDDILGYVKMIPGGEEALKKVPNAQALIELSKSRSEDASKLAKETWDEVLKVLDAKAQKAKELAEGTKQDAEKASKK